MSHVSIHCLIASPAERLTFPPANPQDPSMSQMLESFTNPSQKDQLEERVTRIREDPSLKPILEEIESGGPAAMMRLVIIISRYIVFYY